MSAVAAGSVALAELASAHGVAVRYRGRADRPVAVSSQTVVAVLRALGVDVSTPAATERALAQARMAGPGPLPPTVVAVAGRTTTIALRGPASAARAIAEDDPDFSRELRVGPSGLEVPGDLRPGWYAAELDAPAGRSTATLVVVPDHVGLPAGLRRAWGWAVQLYAMRGAGSWGMGDYRDLADLAAWSGSAEGGRAGLLLCCPLHAVTPVAPIESSPYYPSSRRFRSPLYLRVEDTAEYAAAEPATRRAVDALRPLRPDDLVDRDAVWAAKRAALDLLLRGASGPAAGTERRQRAFAASQGEGLAQFGLFCALAERHGGDWRRWPVDLHDPRGPAVAGARRRLDERVRFHSWLQLLCDEQLAAADAAARKAGMPVGVLHDLAVGVDPAGADAWAMRDVLVPGVTVGAPPDEFNPHGQDWRLPAWHPRRLAEAGYRPYRDMVRTVLRHAGGLRVDHVMGLFRLWWVPEHLPASAGTYVAYDHTAMLGVLLLEAQRAGAVVVGEDLGTVEPRVGDTLRRVGVLGSDVAWFQREPDGRTPRPPARWRELAMASVTTHDLPTVAGWYTGRAIAQRAKLGVLDQPIDVAEAAAAADRAAMLDMLRAQGLLGSGDPTLDEVMLALHRLLAAAPARLVVAAAGDAIGDLRQPNVPGTLDEYPNWRLPLADFAGRAVSLEEFRAHPAVRRLTALMAAEVASGAASGAADAPDPRAAPMR